MKWIKKHWKAATISGVFILLLIGFGVYNIIWYSSVTEYWGKYLEKVERSPEFTDHEVYCITDEEGINYLVKKPNYLSYVGNLSITYPQEKSPVTLLIWPHQDKEWEYGAFINSEDGGEYMLNKDMRPVDTQDEDALKRYYADIDYLYEKAKALWNL